MTAVLPMRIPSGDPLPRERLLLFMAFGLAGERAAPRLPFWLFRWKPPVLSTLLLQSLVAGFLATCPVLAGLSRFGHGSTSVGCHGLLGAVRRFTSGWQTSILHGAAHSFIPLRRKPPVLSMLFLAEFSLRVPTAASFGTLRNWRSRSQFVIPFCSPKRGSPKGLPS